MKSIYRFDVRSNWLSFSLIGLLIFLCILPWLLNSLGIYFSAADAYDVSGQADIFIWTLIHWTGFCAACGTAVLLLVCYAVKKEPILLIMAIVLAVIGIMDVFHTLVLDQLLPGLCQAPRELIAVPWLMVRISYAFLPLLGVGIIVFFKDLTLAQLRKFQWGYSLFVTLWFLVLLYLVLDFCKYPDQFSNIIYTGRSISKPYAFLPLSLFVISIFVFARYAKKYPSRFAYGLLVSLIPSIATQLYLMFGTGLFDNYSTIAYIIKMLAYATLFVALCFDYIATYKSHQDFVSIMSHEMRNSSNVALGLGDCMQKGLDGPINDKQKESLERLVQANRQILAYVNDMLDMNKIASGRAQIVFGDVDLGLVLRNAVGSLEELAKQKGLSLTVGLDNRAFIVEGDALKLSQIFVNLISNAIKYTERGGISISIKEDDSKFFVSVQDTGIGLTEEEIQGLFRPYHQLSQGKTVGTGIGLMIAKNFAQMHFGNILVDSKKGVGSTFTVELPKAKNEKSNGKQVE